MIWVGKRKMVIELTVELHSGISLLLYISYKLWNILTFKKTGGIIIYTGGMFPLDLYV